MLVRATICFYLNYFKFIKISLLRDDDGSTTLTILRTNEFWL
jgi:hypothetical protein